MHRRTQSEPVGNVRQNDCVFHYKLPRSYQFMRNWNKGYLEWSQRNRITRYAEPILIHLYSEVLQKFRLAAQGQRYHAQAARTSGQAHRDLFRSAAVLL